MTFTLPYKETLKEKLQQCVSAIERVANSTEIASPSSPSPIVNAILTDLQLIIDSNDDTLLALVECDLIELFTLSGYTTDTNVSTIEEKLNNFQTQWPPNVRDPKTSSTIRLNITFSEFLHLLNIKLQQRLFFTHPKKSVRLFKEAQQTYVSSLEELKTNLTKVQQVQADLEQLNSIELADGTTDTLKNAHNQAQEWLQSLQEQVSTAEEQSTEINTVQKNTQKVYQSVLQQKEQIDETQREIDEQLQSVEQAQQDYEETQAGYEQLQREVEALKATLAELQEQTKNELAQATSIGQFKEFNAAKKDKEIAANSWIFWFVVMFVLIACIFIGSTVWLYHDPPLLTALLEQLKKGETAILWSLVATRYSLALPFVGFASFCMFRFLKEARLAEEYRFKSTCALHFDSYMKLVEKINAEDTDDVYREFLIRQIERLFTSPTERIYKDSNPSKIGDLNPLIEALEVFFPQLEKFKKLVSSLSSNTSTNSSP